MAQFVAVSQANFNVEKERLTTVENNAIYRIYNSGGVTVERIGHDVYLSASGGGSSEGSASGIIVAMVNVQPGVQEYINDKLVVYMVMIQAEVNPELQGSDWNVTAGDGKLFIDGTIKSTGMVRFTFGYSAGDFLDHYESQLNDKQNKTDSALVTTDKTVVGAINEVKNDTSSLKNDLIAIGYPAVAPTIVYQSTYGAVRASIINNVLVIWGRDVTVAFDKQEMIIGSVALPTGYQNIGMDVSGFWGTAQGHIGTVWFDNQNRLRIFYNTASQTINFINFNLCVPLQHVTA